MRLIEGFAKRREGLIGARILRVGFASIMLWFYLSHFRFQAVLWGPDGQLDYATYLQTPQFGVAPLYRILGAEWFDVAVLIGSIVVTIAYLAGVFPRVSGILFVLATMASVDRNPSSVDAGQNLIVLLSSLLIFADTGRLSLGLELPANEYRTRAATMLHNASRFLVIWQMANVYFWAAYFKLCGEAWRSGAALRYVLGLERLMPFPAISHALIENGLLIAVLTYTTLAVQLLFPFMIWIRPLKPIAVCAAVVLHTGIALLMGLWSFSLTMIVAEVALLTDAQLKGLARVLRLQPSLFRSSSN